MVGRQSGLSPAASVLAAPAAVPRRTWKGAHFGKLKPTPQKRHTVTPYGALYVYICELLHVVTTAVTWGPEGRHCSFPISWARNEPRSSSVNCLALWLPEVFTRRAARSGCAIHVCCVGSGVTHSDLHERGEATYSCWKVR